MENPQNKTSEVFKVRGDWNKQSSMLKEKFPQLNDADLKYDHGKDDELLNRIAGKLNKHKDEVSNIIRKGQPEKI